MRHKKPSYEDANTLCADFPRVTRVMLTNIRQQKRTICGCKLRYQWDSAPLENRCRGECEYEYDRHQIKFLAELPDLSDGTFSYRRQRYRLPESALDEFGLDQRRLTKLEHGGRSYSEGKIRAMLICGWSPCDSGKRKRLRSVTVYCDADLKKIDENLTRTRATKPNEKKPWLRHREVEDEFGYDRTTLDFWWRTKRYKLKRKRIKAPDARGREQKIIQWNRVDLENIRDKRKADGAPDGWKTTGQLLKKHKDKLKSRAFLEYWSVKGNVHPALGRAIGRDCFDVLEEGSCVPRVHWNEADVQTVLDADADTVGCEEAADIVGVSGAAMRSWIDDDRSPYHRDSTGNLQPLGVTTPSDGGHTTVRMPRSVAQAMARFKKKLLRSAGRVIDFVADDGRPAVHVESLAMHFGHSRTNITIKLGWSGDATKSPVLGRKVTAVPGVLEVTSGLRMWRRRTTNAVSLADAVALCEALGKPWPQRKSQGPAQPDGNSETGRTPLANDNGPVDVRVVEWPSPPPTPGGKKTAGEDNGQTEPTTLRRRRLFLDWWKDEKSETHGSPTKICNKWNALTPAERTTLAGLNQRLSLSAVKADLKAARDEDAATNGPTG